jgi:TrpR-related protein YerC/YecD
MLKKQRWENKDTDELFAATLKLRTAEEARRFFRDLLTEPEIKEFANRWKAARMLARKVPYVEIEKATGMSSTTVARIQKWVKKGLGGYQLMLRRLRK